MTVRRIAALLLAAAVLYAAGGVLAEESQSLPVFTYFGEAVEDAPETSLYGLDGERCVAVVEYGGKFYRVVSFMDDKALELNAAVQEAWDSDQETAWNTLDEYIMELPVAYTEPITVSPAGRQELDALAGKTLEELEADGWTVVPVGPDEETGEVRCSLEKGLFEYDVTVNETAEAWQQCEEAGSYGSLTVKQADFAGVSYNAVSLQYRANGTWDPPAESVSAENYDIILVISEEIAAAWNGGDVDKEALIASLTEKYPYEEELIRELVESYGVTPPEERQVQEGERTDEEIEILLLQACYINPHGGTYVHSVPDCTSVHPMFIPLTKVDFNWAIRSQYEFCPVCCRDAGYGSSSEP